MPLGFFDRNTSGQMRKIIDENASETHTFVAHLLPDLAGSFIAPLSVIILIFVFNLPDPPHGGCLHHDTDEYNCSEGVPK